MASAARHLLNPLATPEQVACTPSRSDGVSEQLERDLRAYGALLIQQAGIQLRAPQVVMTTAAVMFQRFWYVSSMKNYGVKDIAAAALFLSSKLEEHPIRIRDLINSFDYLIKRVQWEASQIAIERARSVASGFNDGNEKLTAGYAAPAVFVYEPMDYFAKEFYDFKDEVVIGESQILKRLGFNATVQNPYGNIVNYLQVLSLTDHATIPQKAWSFANDILLTPLLAIHPAHVISVACLYLACLTASPQVVLPTDPAPWWELFDIDDEEDIWTICRCLLDLYRRWTGDDDIAWICQIFPQEGNGMLADEPVRRRSIWRQAAMLRLPIMKSDVRDFLGKS